MRMKLTVKFLFWGVIFTALTFLFYYFGPTQAVALTDGKTAVTLLTEEGPVSMTMAEYLPGAVAAEMPVSFGAEALKAQAVAARTYVLSRARHEDGDVCTDGGCCLAYKDEAALRAFWGSDFEENMRAVRAAVAATDGEYLAYDGQAIQAVFHASSAGATEDSANLWSAQPYLISVSSPETADNVPELITTVTVTADELSETLGLSPAGPPSSWLEGTSLEDSGRVRGLLLCGQAFTGTYIRAAFGLKSTDFTFAWDGAEFVFTVAGNGHGVGMSQYGASLLAAQGYTYEQILAHYYPGTELVRPAGTLEAAR